ncbi:hypothetical protein [Amnibacterium setariae]|uniref:Uncharacterized protein n=1 Tax=Amnibacterium setariae TaxID=2306585 RepID=A0A3A1U1A7_9MICO|nr:hypothetical protein [Amnibacterium setariae]RIX30143.1 hypothetical protein D1781_01430 [Amnibacterium setariae]
MTAPAVPARSGGTRRTWDLVLAIVLAVLLLAAAAVLGFAGAFLVMASDSCGASVTCSTGRLTVGVLVAMIGPAVVAVATIVALVVRIVRARLAFWAPLVGLVVAVLVWAGGAALVFGSVPSS